MTEKATHQIALFGQLSSCLAGAELCDLCPNSELLSQHYEVARGADPDVFDRLISFFEATQTAASSTVTAAMIWSHNDTSLRYMARSILIGWFLGMWYAPKELECGDISVMKPRVVSPTAYLQGHVWKLIGAEPMGYSNMPFGHWSQDPTLNFL